MYKMIVLDLDGTLLNSKEEIDELTRQTIMNVSHRVKIVLASARGFYRIFPYVEKLDLKKEDQYTIAYNGSITLSNLEVIIDEQFISKENLERLMIFMKAKNQYRWSLYGYDFNRDLSVITELNEFIEKHRIYKVVVKGDEKQITKERAQMPSELTEVFEVTSSEPTRFEFVQKGRTKVQAIADLAYKLNIKQDEIVAIGDGENDISMIRYAGLGVAMGNANSKVKAAADFVCEDNEHSGVAQVLLSMEKSGLLFH